MPTKKTSEEQASGSNSRKKTGVRSAPSRPILLPDLSVLEQITPTSDENIQPSWIRERHPDYIAGHDAHEQSTSVHQFAVAGHQYRSIDRVPLWLPVMGKHFMRRFPSVHCSLEVYLSRYTRLHRYVQRRFPWRQLISSMD